MSQLPAWIPVARRKFLESLMKTTEDGEQTVLFSTHITSDLERVASHLAMLKDGRIAVCDELDHLKDRVKRLRISAGRGSAEVVRDRRRLADRSAGAHRTRGDGIGGRRARARNSARAGTPTSR